MDPLIRHKLTRSNHGFAVVLLIMILVIATAIGVWGLRSSQDTLRRIGVRRTVTELKYEAEKGLQKAVLRIQSIANKDITDKLVEKDFWWDTRVKTRNHTSIGTLARACASNLVMKILIENVSSEEALVTGHKGIQGLIGGLDFCFRNFFIVLRQRRQAKT